MFKDKTQLVKLPRKEEIIRFKNYHKMIRAPFVIYADFTCYHEEKKEDQKFGKTCEILAKHIPSGYGLYLKSDYEEIKKSFYKNWNTNTNEKDVSKNFVKDLKYICNEIEKIPKK